MLKLVQSVAMGAIQGETAGMSVERSREAMKYVTDGGPGTLKIVCAKRDATEAAECDKKIRQDTQDAIGACRRSAASLRDISVTDSAEHHELMLLAEKLERRASQYASILEQLGEVLVPPVMTDIEVDAALCLKAQDEGKAKLSEAATAGAGKALDWLAAKVANPKAGESSPSAVAPPEAQPPAQSTTRSSAPANVCDPPRELVD
mmetsp:Transcript_33303/g.89144  ORF Transcript_33303/g.89144 Transcript_33303/m.89144 type:complete len:205 (-) Transcript_33303:123-737(-)